MTRKAGKSERTGPEKLAKDRNPPPDSLQNGPDFKARYEDMDRKIEALNLRFPAKAVRLLFFVVVFNIRFPAGIKTSAFRLADITLLAVNTSHNQHPSFKCVHFLNVFNLRSAL